MRADPEFSHAALCPERHFELPAPLARQLAALAACEGADLALGLLAAVRMLLARHDRPGPLPVALARPEGAECGARGADDCTWLRVDVGDHVSFRQLLQRVSRTGSTAASPDVGGPAPLRALVVHRTAPAQPAHSGAGGPIRVPEPFDLVLTFVGEPRDGPLACEARWREAAGSGPALAASVPAHLRTLLASALAEPDRPIGELTLVGPAERDAVLALGRGEERTWQLDRTVPDLFEERVRASPDRPALTFGGQTLSYRQLNGSANRLAHRLQDLGVGADELVGIELCAGPGEIAAVLGILKAGGAYVPLPPDLPEQRRARIVAESGIGIVLDCGGPRPRDLPAGVRRLSCTDPGLAACPADDPSRSISPDDLCYVTFTSGSTGSPKGVMTPHRALVNHTLAFLENHALAESDCLLQFTPLSFDASASTLYPALLGGARLVLAHPDVLHSIPELLRICAMESVTILNLTVSFAHELAEFLADTEARLPSLRMLVTGGEAPDAARLRAIAALAPRPLAYLNAYGPTEATITTTAHVVPDLASLPDGRVPIGRPLPNVRVLVLDEQQQPVPMGAVGELHVGGVGLARGYLRDPELTAARFLSLAVPGGPPERVYRTGDLARYRADGGLEFLGRVDDQIKVRGVRIEPAELDQALALDPDVKASVVVAQRGSRGETVLCAYVVPASRTLSHHELRAKLQQLLPSFLVPSRITFLERLPVNAHGKVDREALLRRSPAGDDGRRARAEPSLPWEREVAEVFRQVLGPRPVFADDDFFELGGDSLLAVNLITRLHLQYGRTIAPSDLADRCTVAHLAAVLRAGPQARTPGAVLIRPGDPGRSPLFCVHGISGHPLAFLELARCTDTGQPVYGVGFDLAASDGSPVPTIEGLATRVLRSIREVQPHGPYCLLGYSFGGLLAFEVARQLVAAGETVALLALVDTPAPGLYGPPGRLRRLGWHLRRMRGLGARRWPAYVWNRLVGRAGRLVPRRATVAAAPRPEEREIDVLTDTALRATSSYAPEPYPGRVHAFRAATPSEHLFAADPVTSWRELARGGLEVLDVPGSHLTLLRQPDVQALAGHLRALLGNGETAGVGGPYAADHRAR